MVWGAAPSSNRLSLACMDAVNGMLKVVLFWHRELQEQGSVQETREVADLRWVSVEEALDLRTHSNERTLLALL